MVHKILFWSGFGELSSAQVYDTYCTKTLTNSKFDVIGIAVRLWQLGIEMRPLFNKESLWAYPVFAAAGGSFGYWLTGVENRQIKLLAERRQSIIDKRKRRAERQKLVEQTDGVLANASP